jgi:hypothetical protein
VRLSLSYTRLGVQTPATTYFFAKLYNILRWANVPPGRPDTTSRLTSHAWAATAARGPIRHDTVSEAGLTGRADTGSGRAGPFGHL